MAMVLEATGNWCAVYDALVAAGAEVKLAHPAFLTTLPGPSPASGPDPCGLGATRGGFGRRGRRWLERISLRPHVQELGD